MAAPAAGLIEYSRAMNRVLSAEDLLEAARRVIRRYTPSEALEAQAAGGHLIDLRCAFDRESEGAIPGAIAVPLSVVPWRVDPSSASRDERIADREATLILVCNDGYSSSLAAANLTKMGFARAGDVAGGFRAWAASGLPVETAG